MMSLLGVYIFIFLASYVWENNKETYTPYDLTIIEDELGLYQKRKSLYVKLRPDTTTLERTLDQREIDKLRTLTTTLNSALSHQFNYYYQGQLYKDYNKHIISNLNYHINELKEKRAYTAEWLDKNLDREARIQDITDQVFSWLIGIMYTVLALNYLWRVVDSFKEGYYAKDQKSPENEPA